ncbi:MAG: hypothetical protein ACRC2T_08250 [Thermoguttaceae bacterium]
MTQILPNPMQIAFKKLLCRWVDKNPGHYSPLLYDSKSEIETLVDAGWLRPSADADWYQCSCGNDCELHYIEVGGKHAILASCADCGPCRVEPHELRQWDIIETVFINRISAALGFGSPYGVVEKDAIWHLGRRKNREYFLVRQVHWTERKLLQSTFGNKLTATLIVLLKRDVHEMKEYLPNDTFSLEELLEPQSDYSVQANMALIDDGLQAVSPKAKAPRRRGTRLADIEKLTDELKSFYNDSKANYNATGELLPCREYAAIRRHCYL